MKFAVVWTEAAIRDLERIRSYIEGFNPYAAKDVAAGIIDAAEALNAFPHRGRGVHGTQLRETALPYPYIIRYLIDDRASRVTVLRVRHGAQRQD